jgi:predicted phosphodiesterase
MSLRLAFVADIHHGQDSFTKKGSHALRLTEAFVRFVAEVKPDAVIDLGDRISDVDAATDARLEREVAAALAPIAVPRFHICGNHDRDHLSVADNEAILGQSLASTTVDLGDWTLVLWRADTLIRRPGGFILPELDLLWLDAVARHATKPLIVVSHVPISGHSQVGNYYFERNPDASTYPNGADRARRALAAAKVPVVCVAGHVHWNTLTTVDGIAHLTLQSLTESFTTNPEPAAAYGLMEIADGVIDWRVFGLDPFAARLDVERLGRRWVNPLPPFHEHPEIRARRVAAD